MSRLKKQTRKERANLAVFNQQVITQPRPVVGAELRRVGVSCLAMLFRALRNLRNKRPVTKLCLRHTVALGDKRFVAVVEFEGERFLIGGAPNSVSLLARLENVSRPPLRFAEALENADCGLTVQ